MIGIIAVNNKNWVGKENKLMWHSSEDLKHFKEMSKNKIMVVGYNTYQNLPQVVKDRGIIVDQKDIMVNESFDFKEDEKILCIGGKKTYEKYCHLFTELHISHINDDQEGDVKEPDWSNLNKECEVYHYNFEVNK